MMSVRGLQWDIGFRGVQKARTGHALGGWTVHTEATCQCFAPCLTSQACLVVGCMQPTFLAGPVQMSNPALSLSEFGTMDVLSTRVSRSSLQPRHLRGIVINHEVT